MTTVYLVGNGTGSITPPSTATWTVECWGAGGPANNATGGGGIGGGYAKLNSFSAVSGTPVSFSLGAPGTTDAGSGGGTGQGGDTWFSAIGTVLANGGGSTTTQVGNTTFAGGAGGAFGATGASPGVGGGGGAAGPSGAGEAGLAGGVDTGAGGGGGGGGAANAGTGGGAGASPNGGAGGGSAGGAGGTSGTVTGAAGGRASGGGGGVGGVFNATIGSGGIGGDDYDHGGGGAGGSGNGAGSGNASGSNGGTPGGGGSGPAGAGTVIGAGGWGLIKISYTGTDPNQIQTFGTITEFAILGITAIAGSGSVTANATHTPAGAAHVVGAGSVAPKGTHTPAGAPHIVGAGAVVAKATTIDRQSSAKPAGVGSVTAVATVIASATSTVSGTGAVIATGINPNSSTTTIYLVGNGTGSITPTNNAVWTVQCWGAGQSSVLGASDSVGGIGGGWTQKNAYSATSGTPISFSLGAPGVGVGVNGGDTWFATNTTVIAAGGGSATTQIGDNVNVGGGAGHGTFGYGSGGGAAGPRGAGNAGGSTDVSGTGGPGGGGNGGGTAGTDVTTQTTGTAGGNGFAGIGGGGGVSGASGAPGGLGAGGGGGDTGATPGNGGQGGDDYDNGGGGGGAGAFAGATVGGNGGTPGGGGGSGSGATAGSGGWSLIKITYTGTDPNQIQTFGSITVFAFLAVSNVAGAGSVTTTATHIPAGAVQIAGTGTITAISTPESFASSAIAGAGGFGNDSRSTVANYFDAIGTLQTAQPYVLRNNTYTYNGSAWVSAGALIEAASTNVIENPRCEGINAGVAGSGGVGPTDWGNSGLGTCTVTWVGNGYESGIPYVDLSIVGTPSASEQFAISIDTASAAPSSIWTQSSYFRLTAGSLSGVTALGMQINGSAGPFTGFPVTPTSAALSTQQNSGTVTLGASSTNVQLYFQFSVTISVPVSFTVRIGGPQLEQAAAATSLILPPIGSPAVSSRDTDAFVGPGPLLLAAATATAAGSGAVTATALTPESFAAAAISGAGSLLASAAHTPIGIIGNGATGAASATAAVVTGGTVSIGGTGAVTANTIPESFAASTIGGAGAASATAAVIISTQIFSRSSVATYFDNTGTLQTAAVDVERFGFNPTSLAFIGPILESASTNLVVNPRAEGAVVGDQGSGGSVPPNWGGWAVGGITVTIVGSGYESGIPYLEIQYHGTPTSDGQYVQSLASNVAATIGQVWTFSAYCRLTAGSTTNFSTGGHPNSISLRIQDNSQFPDISVVPTSAVLSTQRFSSTITIGATTGFGCAILFDVTNGNAIDGTFRIGAPQLELNATPTSLILPPIGTPGVAARSADIFTAGIASTFSGAGSVTTAATIDAQSVIAIASVGTVTALAIAPNSINIAINGAGSVTATAIPESFAAAAISGVGSITANAVPESFATAAISGAGAIAAVATQVDTRSVITANGAGSVTAIAIPESFAVSAISGAGSVTITTTLIAQTSGTINGIGSAPTNAIPESFAAAAITGGGLVTTVATKIDAQAVASVVAVGSVVTSASHATFGIVSINGVGSAVATSTPESFALAAINGAGSVVPVTAILIDTQAVIKINGISTIIGTTVGVSTWSGSTTITGTGGSATAATLAESAIIALAGVGSAPTLATHTPSAVVAIGGAGAIISSAAEVLQTTVAISGSSTVQVAAIHAVGDAPVISGNGTVQTTALVLVAGHSAVIAAGALFSTARLTPSAVVGVAGSGTAVSDSTPLLLLTPASAIASGSGSVVANAIADHKGQIAVTGVAFVVANALVRRLPSPFTLASSQRIIRVRAATPARSIDQGSRTLVVGNRRR